MSAAKHTARAGRLRLVRLNGIKVYTYPLPTDVKRAGVTNHRKET